MDLLMEHLKRVTDICANRGEAIELLGDKNIQLRAKIDEQAATIARLTAGAVLNDMAWKDNQAALKAQAAEIARLTDKVRYAYVQIEALERVK